MKHKKIYLLIGPKGSGKSYIGELIQEQFGIQFLRVEDWLLDVKKEREVMDTTYLEEVFSIIEQGIRRALESTDKVVFESTGLTKYFDDMFESLNADFDVKTVGISSPPDQCLERIQSRDQSIHIPISMERIESINQQVVNRNLTTNYSIENIENGDERLIKGLNQIIEF